MRTFAHLFTALENRNVTGKKTRKWPSYGGIHITSLNGMFWCAISFLFLWSVALSGCKRDKKQAISFVAKPFVQHACAACGMIVREQSSPRGQVIHRDGYRAYFCSISDMLSYLFIPSPHGKIKARFVELLKPTDDPLRFSTKQERWIEAERAFYVLGVPKKRVMGIPILSYRDRSSAQQIAKRYHGTVHSWTSLQRTWRKLRNRHGSNEGNRKRSAHDSPSPSLRDTSPQRGKAERGSPL